MPKAINPDSVRQRILETMFNANRPMKAAEIVKALVDEGFDRKKVPVHSHLQAFKAAKVPLAAHNSEDSTYELTDAARERFVSQRELELA